MAQDVATLPRDPETLIGIIVDLQDENDRLRVMLETLSRTVFGPRSEQLVESDERQMDLTLGDLSGMPAEPVVLPGFDPTREPRTRPRARCNIGGLPKHLPREDVAIEPESDKCPCCRGKLHKVGEDVSEMLDIVPAILRVIRLRRPRYGCRACESTMVQAPAPERPVANGLPTSALLAHVAVSKLAWHIPLHR